MQANDFENARPATDEEYEAHLDQKYAQMGSGDER